VESDLIKKTVAYFKKKKIALLPISAATSVGIDELIGKILIF